MTADAARRPPKLLASIALDTASIDTTQLTTRERARQVISVVRHWQQIGDEAKIAEMEDTLKVKRGWFAEICAKNHAALHAKDEEAELRRRLEQIERAKLVKPEPAKVSMLHPL